MGSKIFWGLVALGAGMWCAKVMVSLRALSRPVGSDGVIEPACRYSSTVLEYHFWGRLLVLATRGTRLVLVLEGRCTRYSVKKSAEYTRTFGFL